MALQVRPKLGSLGCRTRAGASARNAPAPRASSRAALLVRAAAQSWGHQRAHHRRADTPPGRAAADEFVDYYKVLGVEPSCDHGDIKRAYRRLHKHCHPDVAGSSLGHDLGVLLNDAYRVLSDPRERRAFDAARAEALAFEDFTGAALSSWAGPAAESRAVFVDEGACIGCLKCALEASNTFKIEMKYGKARAVTQWGDSEERIELAASICPVSCIHWVDRRQLPELEYVMRRSMRQTHGRPKNDPFIEAAAFHRQRTAMASTRPDHPQGRAWEGGMPPYASAASSILAHGLGSGSPIWDAATKSGRKDDPRALVSSRHSSAPSWRKPTGAMPGVAEYLKRMAAMRRGAPYDHMFHPHTHAEGVDSVHVDEYWERFESEHLTSTKERRPQSRPGKDQNDSLQRTRSSPALSKEYVELLEAEKRRRQYNLLLSSALACLLLFGVRFEAEHQEPVSAAQCYQQGGGLCRFHMK